MKSARAVLGCAAAVIGVACLDVGSPPGGVASFTTIIRPSPSVVVGDDMRDSTGAVTPLRVFAFGEHGDTLKNLTITFLSIDTTKPPAISVQPDGHVHGDSVRSNIAGSFVVANVAGSQTLPDTIRVSVPPERSTLNVQQLLHLTLLSPTDSTSPKNQDTLRLTVTGSLPVGAKGAPADTFAVGFIVDYRIISAPASSASGKAVRLLNDANKDATRDTTSASEPGVASLRLKFNPAFFADQELIGGTKTDTVKVEVTVRYNGHAAAQTPDTFVVPVKVGP
jgi:hypothetical protein